MIKTIFRSKSATLYEIKQSMESIASTILNTTSLPFFDNFEENKHDNLLDELFLFSHEYRNECSLDHKDSCLQEPLEKFKHDFKQIIWLTYRKNCFQLAPMFTGDAGWGCMLRTAQMMLARCLQRHFGQAKTKRDIIKLFIDAPKYFSVFSIHNMCMYGKKYNMKVGQWYGPNTASLVLRDLVNGNSAHVSNLISHVVDDGMIYLEEVTEVTENFTKSLFLLCPLRLGLNEFNACYHEPLLKLMKTKASVGIVGGKPMKSLFFVGSSSNDLIYLDPHYVQPCVKTDSGFNQLITDEELMTYSCSKIRTMSSSELDPSMTVGFYCKDQEVFCELVQVLKSFDSKHAFLGVAETRPSYDLDLSDSASVASIDASKDEFVVL